MDFQHTNYKLTEFFLIFIVMPLSLVFTYPVWLKLGLGITGFVYICWMLLRVEKQRFKLNEYLNWKAFWKRTGILLACIGVLTLIYVSVTDVSKLFIVIRTKPLLWLFILFFYSVFSVYPQELIYRTFFFYDTNLYLEIKDS